MPLPSPRCRTSVQPRVCGESVNGEVPVFFLLGSTPRLRGIPVRDFDGLIDLGFNPASVGNPARCRRRPDEQPVQPRACGESTASASVAVFALGSTPRLRGIRSHIASPTNHRRFNPAPAGNPTPRGPLPWQSAVQPRACGESRVLHDDHITTLGSTPRLRGFRSDRPWCCAVTRFNPAPAGNP